MVERSSRCIHIGFQEDFKAALVSLLNSGTSE